MLEIALLMNVDSWLIVPMIFIRAEFTLVKIIVRAAIIVKDSE